MLERRAVLGGRAWLSRPWARTSRAQARFRSPPRRAPEEVRLHTDWPFLQRYAAENAVDRDLPAVRRRAVFLGELITRRAARKHPAFFTENGFLGRGIGGGDRRDAGGAVLARRDRPQAGGGAHSGGHHDIAGNAVT